MLHTFCKTWTTHTKVSDILDLFSDGLLLDLKEPPLQEGS